jgi:dynactin complex subunit
MEHKCINEERLRKLEHSEAIMGTKIESLTKELEKLTSALRSLVWVMIPTILGAFGFLVAQYVK